MEVHGLNFGRVLVVALRDAPEPERFAGREELVKEEVEIGDRPAETQRDRRTVWSCAPFGKLYPPQRAAFGPLDKAPVSLHHSSDDALMEAEVVAFGQETTLMTDELGEGTEMLVEHIDSHLALWDGSPVFSPDEFQDTIGCTSTDTKLEIIDLVRGRRESARAELVATHWGEASGQISRRWSEGSHIRSRSLRELTTCRRYGAASRVGSVV